MHDHLDRLCLPWVLEYLEANRRVHIISRAPGLQNLNRRTPLRLNSLEFRDDSTRINDVVYRITTEKNEVPWNEEEFRREEKLQPGDIAITPRNGIWSRKEVRIQFMNTQSAESRAVSQGISVGVANKKLLSALLGHPDVYVKTMSFPLRKVILKIPMNFQPRVFCLDSQKREFFHFTSLLHPSCLPLKALRTEIPNAELLEHPFLKAVETLTILDAKFTLTLELLQNISNKHVQIMKDCLNQRMFLDLISFWKDNVTEIGRTFEVGCRKRENAKKLLETAKSEFNGKYSRSFNELCLTLPMDSDTAELVIFDCFETSGSIRMEVMAREGPYSATMNDDRLACIACILEYLEANKRIHITARSPVLQNFASSVPLRLDKLTFRDDSIGLNSITYTIKNHLRQEANWNEEDFRNEPRTEELLPGDFLIPPKNGIWTVGRLGIDFKNKEQNSTKMLPPGSQKPFALKFLSNSILGYDSVLANSLVIDFKAQNSVLRVPVDFKVLVRNLDTQSQRFTDFVSIIHPDSLPLKSLTTTIYTPEDLDHTLLKTSERVVIRPSEFEVTIQRLRDLTNKHVEINWYNVSQKKLDQLIIFWKRTWKETGSTWHSMYLGKRGTMQALQAFQDKFNGFKAFWVVPKEKIHKMGVCIPMNFKSELFICGETFDKKHCFEMTVLPKGSVKPHVQKRKFNDQEEE
ncbi:unnamed protein product [Caenorhabditis brenneri]